MTSSFTCPLSAYKRRNQITVLSHLSCRCYLERPETWASLTVHGFMDSPVSWGENEHGFLTGGENFYSLLLLHGHAYQLHLATGAQDACPP